MPKASPLEMLAKGYAKFERVSNLEMVRVAFDIYPAGFWVVRVCRELFIQLGWTLDESNNEWVNPNPPPKESETAVPTMIVASSREMPRASKKGKVSKAKTADNQPIEFER